MEINKILSPKLSLVAFSLLTLSIVGNVIFLNKQKKFKNNRDETILKLDSLLSVKLLVDKELDKAKTQIGSYKIMNSELDKTLADTDLKLNSSKIQIEELEKDNASINALQKKLKEFKKLREECEKLVNEYIRENEKLANQNNILNPSVNKLSQQLEEIKAKMEFAKNLKAYDIVIMNYKVSSRSSKPTVKARRVNRISATFDLAENPVAESGSKEIYMVVYDTNGNIVGPQNKKFINKASKKEQVYSTLKSLEYKNEEVRSTINFLTEQKLIKGNYKIELYVDGAYSGKKEFILK